jgi:hypothetical protein
MPLIKKILKWVGIVLGSTFIILVIVRAFYLYNLDNTNAQVAKIHATKLTLDDVMGKNLPPDPGADADKTVAGIDANQNGIRDDVELAVFKAYPNSAKTRAVLLQYALALQMEFIQPIVNTSTATEVIREEDRASSCISDTLVPGKNSESFRSDAEMKKIDTYINFIKNLQINTQERDQAQINFYENLRSYNSLNRTCDIDYSTLPN